MAARRTEGPELGCSPEGRSQPRGDKIVLSSPLEDRAVLLWKDMACEDWRSSGVGGSGAMPARLVAGDTLADACCCASMPQVGATADISLVEGWGRKGVISNLRGVWRGG